MSSLFFSKVRGKLHQGQLVSTLFFSKVRGKLHQGQFVSTLFYSKARLFLQNNNPSTMMLLFLYFLKFLKQSHSDVPVE